MGLCQLTRRGSAELLCVRSGRLGIGASSHLWGGDNLGGLRSFAAPSYLHPRTLPPLPLGPSGPARSLRAASGGHPRNVQGEFKHCSLVSWGYHNKWPQPLWLQTAGVYCLALQRWEVCGKGVARWVLQEALGEDPSFLSQLLGAPGVLGLWPHSSSLCLPLCACIFSSCEDTPLIELGPIWLQCDLVLT